MQLLNLAQKLYRGRDKSHGLTHVKKVRENALLICNKLNVTDPTTLIKIETAALFHDLWDHKYVKQDSWDYVNIKNNFYHELKNRYFSDHDIQDIEIIINNISLSYEMKLRKNNDELDLKHLQFMRDIVSDADKLEMLGIHGFDRIIEYQMYKYPRSSSNDLKRIIKNVYETKISKLLSHNYIRTEPAKELARPLMQEMDNYIKMIRI